MKLSKRGKKRIVNAFAGITAVCISPSVAGLVVRNAGSITYSVSNTLTGVGEYMQIDDPVVLSVNPDYFEMYKPIAEPELPYVKEEEMSGLVREYEPTQETLQLTQDGQHSQSNEVMSFNMAHFNDDLTVYNNADGEIVKMTFLSNPGENYINLEKGGQVRNETELSNEFVRKVVYTKPDIKLELKKEPEVLIMHTHTSESFQLPGNSYFDGDYPNRSNDPEQNIVAVGAEIAAALAENGISVIHDGTIHDYPEYTGSYSRSAITVSELLQMYPSIKVVLDIHRDAITDGDSPVAAVTEISGEQAAQVMIISAADDGNYNIPDYLQNLKLASHLQQQMESDNPGITRPVLFQYCHYNQDLSAGSLLIEVGSHGNTIEEAVNAGRLIGESISKALLELSG